MSVTNYQLTEEHLWCCICLDVFRNPVTLPCGHNFCRSCILKHLTSSPQRQCPMCKERVEQKQKLGVNTFISELAVQYRQSAGRRTQEPAETPGQAPDPSARTKRLSSRSCLLAAFSLTCFILFFTANLCFHQTLSDQEALSLLASVESSDSVCTEHSEPLELYCRNEQMTICQSCRASSHRAHQVVPVKDQYEEKKAELRKTEARIQQLIWKRRLKIQELKRSMELSEEAADREMADGVQIFSALIQTLERAQADLIGMIEEKQKGTEKQAQSFLAELEQEVSELMRRRVEVEQLSRSKDPLQFLQTFPVLNAVPPTKDWTQARVCPVAYEGLMRTVMVGAVQQLSDTVRSTMKDLQDAERTNLQQFSVDVTLDPDTAHPALVLSDDRKQVHCGEKPPEDSRRHETPHVLGKQSFSCGRFYYDVQVKGKTAWTVGVVGEPFEEKLKPGRGFWAVRLQNREYAAVGESPVRLSVKSPPEKVRVFVDYDEGLVSFYDVHAAVLLHSFTGCSFSDRLYPFLSPGLSEAGRNSAPLIL